MTLYRTDELHRDFAVLSRTGAPSIVASHLDIAEGYAARTGLTVVRRIVTVTYEPVEAQRVAA